MDNSDKYLNFFEELEDDLDFKVEYKILEITEEICNMMDEKGLKRADFSKLLGTSKSAVTKMLNGSTNFTLKRLLKIAIALDKGLDISFPEPKKAINFNDTKGTELTPFQIEDDTLAPWNDRPPTHRPQNKKKEEPIAA